MDANPVGPDDDNLTAENVRDLLRLSIFVAGWATNNRDQSIAYNVMQKIFRGTPLREVKSWFHCSWCNLIMYVQTRAGTTPLLRHVKKCDRRPAGYTLPDRNIHLERRGVRFLTPPPSPEPASQSSEIMQIEQPQTSQMPEETSQSPVQQESERDNLAVVLSRISEIGMIYGFVSAAEFKEILPTANESW